MSELNLDNSEVENFSKVAKIWWDINGAYRTLHQVNPFRVDFIKQNTSLEGKSILDLGCGGGILSESLAKSGALVSGIDASKELIEIAKLHSLDSDLNINYQNITAEEFAGENQEKFDILVCMELLEHVPDAGSIIKAASSMLKPGGKLFFSTLNRNIKAYFSAILGAEYVLGLIPKGTHTYSKFIRPSELNTCAEKYDLSLDAISGFTYNLLTKKFKLSNDVSINYICCYTKNIKENKTDLSETFTQAGEKK